MDALAAILAAHIGRVEATLGGRPIKISGRLVEWGEQEQEASADDVRTILERAIRGRHFTRSKH